MNHFLEKYGLQITCCILLCLLLGAVSQPASGQAVFRLTMYDGNDYPRGWSADGTQILVESSSRTLVEGFLLFERGRSSPTLLTLPVAGLARLPAWSGDDSQLAFVLRQGGMDELWVYELASQRLQKVFREDTIIDPAWSAQGDRLVFCAGNMTLRYLDIYQYTPATGQVQQLVAGNRLNYHPALSPSGALLAYATKPAASWDIFSYDFATGRSGPLLNSKEDEENPLWYDEGVLLYLGKSGVRREVFRYALAGGEPVRLTNNSYTENGFLLSPDKRLICFYDFLTPTAQPQQTEVFILKLGVQPGEAGVTGGGAAAVDPYGGFIAERPGWESKSLLEQQVQGLDELYRQFEAIE